MLMINGWFQDDVFGCIKFSLFIALWDDTNDTNRKFQFQFLSWVRLELPGKWKVVNMIDESMAQG